jgi:DNA mismatch repair protein MSH2
VTNLKELTDDQNTQLIYEKCMAAGATQCAIDHLNLFTDTDNFGYFQLHLLQLGEYMKLDQATLFALNIPRKSDEPKNQSLYGLLDMCKTRIGSRRLETFLFY